MRAVICLLAISAASSFSSPLRSGKAHARLGVLMIPSCSRPAPGAASYFPALQQLHTTRPVAAHPAVALKDAATALGPGTQRHHPDSCTATHPAVVLKNAAIALRSRAEKGVAYCMSALLRTACRVGRALSS